MNCTNQNKVYLIASSCVMVIGLVILLATDSTLYRTSFEFYSYNNFTNDVTGSNIHESRNGGIPAKYYAGKDNPPKSKLLAEINDSTPPSPYKTSKLGVMRPVNSNYSKYIVTVFRAGRLGNNLFQYAAALSIARILNQTFILDARGRYRAWSAHKTHFDTIFKLTHLGNITRDVAKSFILFKNKGSAFKYDKRFKSLPQGRHILLRGFFQSYKYFQESADQVRKEFQFVDSIQEKSRDLLQRILASRSDTVSVGLHVRRGDKTRHREKYVQPTTYFTHAMDLMRRKYGNVTFLVATDDRPWALETGLLKGDDVFVLDDAAGEVHMCAITKCDHIIITEGTFSWWSGFLNKGDVIYFNTPYVKGSKPYKAFYPDDFWPKTWIGLSNDGLSIEAKEKLNSTINFFSVDFEVFGRVQGVHFRAHTQMKAEKLGLFGWVQNTSYGTVMGTVEGPRHKIEEMKNWLQTEGSPGCEIDRCEFSGEKYLSSQTFSSFQIQTDLLHLT